MSYALPCPDYVRKCVCCRSKVTQKACENSKSIWEKGVNVRNIACKGNEMGQDARAGGRGSRGRGWVLQIRHIRIWDTARDHTLQNIYRFFANDGWAVRPRLLHDRGKMWAKMGINLLGRMCVYYEYKKGFLMANSKETAPTVWIGVWYIIFEMTGYSTYIHGIRGCGVTLYSVSWTDISPLVISNHNTHTQYIRSKCTCLSSYFSWDTGKLASIWKITRQELCFMHNFRVRVRV